MKIAIANDHNGVKMKNKLQIYLNNLGYEVVDLGSKDGETVDYPDYAFKVGQSVLNRECDLGILICGTGIGMSIACNKIKGIRCAKVSNANEARLSKQHNNANVIAISSKQSLRKTKKIVSTFISTSFSNEERHIRRNEIIDNYD